MDLGAQDQQKNPKSEGLQWDLGILELDLRFRGGLSPSPIGLSPIGAARVNVFDTEKVSHTLPDMRIPKVLLHSPKNEFLAQK